MIRIIDDSYSVIALVMRKKVKGVRGRMKVRTCSISSSVEQVNKRTRSGLMIGLMIHHVLLITFYCFGDAQEMV